jgi:epoxyqueuosine reductase
VLIAIGNSGDASLAAHAENLMASPSPLVRGAAVWALARLVDAKAFSALAQRRARTEDDTDVIKEWAKETQSDKK